MMDVRQRSASSMRMRPGVQRVGATQHEMTCRPLYLTELFFSAENKGGLSSRRLYPTITTGGVRWLAALRH